MSIRSSLVRKLTTTSGAPRGHRVPTGAVIKARRKDITKSEFYLAYLKREAKKVNQ